MNELRVVTMDAGTCRAEATEGIGGGGEPAQERVGSHACSRTDPRNRGRRDFRWSRWIWRIHNRAPFCPTAG
jgi:hypothetical protein